MAAKGRPLAREKQSEATGNYNRTAYCLPHRRLCRRFLGPVQGGWAFSCPDGPHTFLAAPPDEPAGAIVGLPELKKPGARARPNLAEPSPAFLRRGGPDA